METFFSYTDNDNPADEATLLRQQAEFFVIAIRPPTVNTELLLQLAGDTDHIFQMNTAIEYVLPSFLPTVSWQLTCDGRRLYGCDGTQIQLSSFAAWSGTFGVSFITDIDWDPNFAVEDSPERLAEIQAVFDQVRPV